MPLLVNRFACRRALTLAAVLLLGGCVAPPGAPSDPAASEPPAEASLPSSLPVAVDLVSALVQLDGYSPYDTTIQVNEPRDEFGLRLMEALEIAGYGLQQVSADQGRNYLAYDTWSVQSPSGPRIDFELRLGFMSIGREVRVDDGQFVPTAPIRLRGAPPGPIALNGSVYVARPAEPLLYPSGVRFLDADGGLVSETTYRYAWYPTGATDDEPEARTLEPDRYLRQATGRLYERAGDNIALGLRPASDFDPQKSLTVRFPVNSDERLGQGNRNALETLVSFFDASQDRLTILSCTFDRGRSAATLARSTRVKSELLTLDVPGAQILETGCPDGTKRSVARAGVLVTLERLRPNANRP